MVAAAWRNGDNIAITCGIAFAHDCSTVADAIEHADEDLYRQRRALRTPPTAGHAGYHTIGDRPDRSPRID